MKTRGVVDKWLSPSVDRCGRYVSMVRPQECGRDARIAASGKEARLHPFSPIAYRYDMQLGEEDIREFAEIWHQEFGERLAPEEARHHASRLLEIYWILARPPGEAEREPHPSSPAIKIP